MAQRTVITYYSDLSGDEIRSEAGSVQFGRGDGQGWMACAGSGHTACRRDSGPVWHEAAKGDPNELRLRELRLAKPWMLQLAAGARLILEFDEWINKSSGRGSIAIGVDHEDGSASHPQTQGKVERFHQTQNKWLAARPAAPTLKELQTLLDQFRHHYNTARPHRGINRRTPAQAYTDLPKAEPASQPGGHYRLRYDHVDTWGKVSIRRSGRMHHLGTGASNRGKEILAILDNTTATVIELRTGEILSTHTIDPNKNYWRNTQKSPGRWPGDPS